MRQGNSRQLFEYWDRLRGDRAAPRRDEVEPSDIRQLLSDTFILQVSGAMRTVSYRLAGTRLCAAFGRELKGYGFLGHWAEEDCFDVAKALTRVYRDMQPSVLVMRGKTGSDKIIDYEFIMLPLEPMYDGSARILGIASPSKALYWLGTEPLISCRLRSTRQLTGNTADGHAVPGLAPSLASANALEGEGEPQKFFVEDKAGSRKVAHLVIHDGGKE